MALVMFSRAGAEISAHSAVVSQRSWIAATHVEAGTPVHPLSTNFQDEDHSGRSPDRAAASRTAPHLSGTSFLIVGWDVANNLSPPTQSLTNARRVASHLPGHIDVSEPPGDGVPEALLIRGFMFVVEARRKHPYRRRRSTWMSYGRCFGIRILTVSTNRAQLPSKYRSRATLASAYPAVEF